MKSVKPVLESFRFRTNSSIEKGEVELLKEIETDSHPEPIVHVPLINLTTLG